MPQPGAELKAGSATPRREGHGPGEAEPEPWHANFNLSEDQIDDLVAFLITLK